MRYLCSVAGAVLLMLVGTMASQAAGDVEAGASKAAACAACHGADGNSSDPNNPKLAGQVPGYIAAQLAAFKSGARVNAIMAGLAAPLSEQDMLDLDAYYAAQTPTAGAVAEDQLALAQQGGKVYRGGYRPMAVAACMSCHGPTGVGIPPQYPRVSGQHPAYLERQLLDYKSGARTNAIMNDIAFRLSAEQIKALASYMYALD